MFSLLFNVAVFSSGLHLVFSTQCHCRTSTGCQSVDGKCADGLCAVGWTNPPYCQTACPGGSFGDNCNKACRCLNGEPCDHVTGVCQSGRCVYGWGGASCQLELPRLTSSARVTEVGPNHVVVTWPAWKRGYDPGHMTPKIYLLEFDDNGDRWTVVDTFPAGQVSYRATVSSLQPWRRYNIRVTLQYDDDGKHVTSLPGTPTSFTTKCDVPSAAPDGVTITADLAGRDVHLTATWQELPSSLTNCGSVSSYDVMICCTNDACAERKLRVSGTKMSTSIRAPYNASRAYVTVAAVNNEDFMGQRSKRVGVDIPVLPPRPTAPAPPGESCHLPPEGLHGEVEGQNKVTLTWEKPKCNLVPSYYKIGLQQLTGPLGSRSEKQYRSRDSSVIFPDLEPGSQYRISVAPVYGDLPGREAELDIWTVPRDPPEIDRYPEVLNTTDQTIILRIYPPASTAPYSSLNIIVGRTRKEVKVVTRSPEVNKVEKMSRKTERVIGVNGNVHMKHQMELSSTTKNISYLKNNTVSINMDNYDGHKINDTSAKLPLADKRIPWNASESLKDDVTIKRKNKSSTLRDIVSEIPTFNSVTSVIPQQTSSALNVTSAANVSNSTLHRHKRESVTPTVGPRDTPFKPDELQGYDWTEAQLYYVAAEISSGAVDEGIVFVLGDAKSYGGYYNAPLDADLYDHVLWFGVVVAAGDKTKAAYYQVVPKPTHPGGSPRTAGGGGGMSGWAVALLVVLLLLLLVGLLIIVVIAWKRHRQHFPAKYADLITYHRTHSSQVREVSLLTNATADERYNSSVAMGDRMLTLPPRYMSANLDYENECNSNVISTKHFVTYFDDKVRCEQALKYEHNTLPRGFTACYNAAMLPSNILKNRSPSVVPYDKNRAVLIKARDGDSDYINASVIKLSEKKTFIATQAPMATSANDMWRLVWDYDVTTVVLIMDLKERNKPEVERYWPLDGHAQSYGDIAVRSLNTETFADMTSRLFRLNRYGHGEGRLVRHLQYHWWTVGGVPLHTIPFLQFIRKAERHTRPGSTVLVQCHTGGGRCGLYMAVDHLISEGKDSGRVDVFKCVTKLRLERTQLVGTLAQYRFIHACLAEAFSRVGTLILNDQFRSYYDTILHDAIGRHSYVLSAEFEDVKRYDKAMVLRSQTLPVGLSSLYRTPDRRVPVTTAELRSASVCQRHHGTLYDVMLDAYYVDSYLRRDAFILTQTPVALQHVQFWDVVYNSRTTCVISCEAAVDGSFFWPKISLSRKMGPYVVSNDREVACEAGMYMRRDLTVKLESDEAVRSIRQYQMCNWPPGAPAPSIPQLMDMLNGVTEYQGDTGCIGPALVHCTDAVTRSALLTACWILLQKAEVEGEVDIYRTAKYMRHNAPGALPNMEQYKFCYSFLSHYIKVGKFCHQIPTPADGTEATLTDRKMHGGSNIQSSGKSEKSTGRNSSTKKRLSAIFSKSPKTRKTNESSGRRLRSPGNGHCTPNSGTCGKSPLSSKARNTDPRSHSLTRKNEKLRVGRTKHETSREPRNKSQNCSSKKKRQAPPRPGAPPPPTPGSEPLPTANRRLGAAAPPVPGVSPPWHRLTPASHGVSPSIRPSPNVRGSSPTNVVVTQGASPFLTPHSRIAKARRDYFGLESPVAKHTFSTPAPIKRPGEVRKKLFDTDNLGVSQRSSAPEHSTGDRSGESGDDSECEYSVYDISAELHSQNTTNTFPSTEKSSLNRRPTTERTAGTERTHNVVKSRTKSPEHKVSDSHQCIEETITVQSTPPSVRGGYSIDVFANLSEKTVSHPREHPRKVTLKITPTSSQAVPTTENTTTASMEICDPEQNKSKISNINNSNATDEVSESRDSDMKYSSGSFNNILRSFPLGDISERAVSFDDVIREVKLRSRSHESQTAKAQSCDDILTAGRRCEPPEAEAGPQSGADDELSNNQSADCNGSNIRPSKANTCLKDTFNTDRTDSEKEHDNGNNRDKKSKDEINVIKSGPDKKGVASPVRVSFSAYSARREGPHGAVAGARGGRSYESVISARGFKVSRGVGPASWTSDESVKPPGNPGAGRAEQATGTASVQLGSNIQDLNLKTIESTEGDRKHGADTVDDDLVEAPVTQSPRSNKNDPDVDEVTGPEAPPVEAMMRLTNAKPPRSPAKKRLESKRNTSGKTGDTYTFTASVKTANLKPETMVKNVSEKEESTAVRANPGKNVDGNELVEKPVKDCITNIAQISVQALAPSSRGSEVLSLPGDEDRPSRASRPPTAPSPLRKSRLKLWEGGADTD